MSSSALTCFLTILCLSMQQSHGFVVTTSALSTHLRSLHRTILAQDIAPASGTSSYIHPTTNSKTSSPFPRYKMSDSDEYNETPTTRPPSKNNDIFQKKKKANIKKIKPQNEFSRPIHTDVILSPRSSRRQYNSDITADEEELENLAKRFSLSKISKLHAELVLTKDNARSASGSSSRSVNSGACIQVTGDVVAEVTQTCVRTNENFDVDLEFSIFSIVRASEIREVRQNNELGGMSLAQIEGQLGGGGNGGGKKKGGKTKRKGGGGGIGKGSALNDMQMKEIESLLQDFDVEDDIFEDENVLGSDGVLDVGELVAQMFRLKLDPYPKKPGSEPVSYSISG